MPSIQNIAAQGSISITIRDLIGKAAQRFNKMCSGVTGSRDTNLSFVVMSRLGLGAGKSLTLVEVAGRKFLVAAGTDNISAVIRLEADLSIAPADVSRSVIQ